MPYTVFIFVSVFVFLYVGSKVGSRKFVSGKKVESTQDERLGHHGLIYYYFFLSVVKW